MRDDDFDKLGASELLSAQKSSDINSAVKAPLLGLEENKEDDQSLIQLRLQTSQSAVQQR